jgi:hypothetical protein
MMRRFVFVGDCCQTCISAGLHSWTTMTGIALTGTIGTLSAATGMGAFVFLTGNYEYRRPDGSLMSRSMELTKAGTALLAKAHGSREVTMEKVKNPGIAALHDAVSITMGMLQNAWKRDKTGRRTVGQRRYRSK